MTRSGGFTLIELVVTMAILGIFLSIVLPGYSEHMDRSRRAEARAALAETAAWMERSFSSAMQYPSAEQLPESLRFVPRHAGTATAHYILSISPAPPPGTEYRLQAMRSGLMAADPCGDFVLDSTQERSLERAAPEMSAEHCWNR